jgi:hypothetical protein
VALTAVDLVAGVAAVEVAAAEVRGEDVDGGRAWPGLLPVDRLWPVGVGGIAAVAADFETLGVAEPGFVGAMAEDCAAAEGRADTARASSKLDAEQPDTTHTVPTVRTAPAAATTRRNTPTCTRPA